MSGREGRIEKWVKIYSQVPSENKEIFLKHFDEIKNYIEEKLKVKVEIDNSSSLIIIEPLDNNTSPADMIKTRDIIQALSIGFVKEEALRLLDEENVLITVDIKSKVGDSNNHIKRVLGRIIGEDGRAKKTIEEITGTSIHIGNNVIGIIGDYNRATIAQYGIELLIDGKMHSTVYKRLESMMRDIKRQDLTNLWEKKF